MTIEQELTNNLRAEMDAWYGLLNKIDKELSSPHIKLVPKNDPLLVEADNIRQNALKRIGEIERRLGLGSVSVR